MMARESSTFEMSLLGTYPANVARDKDDLHVARKVANVWLVDRLQFSKSSMILESSVEAMNE